jgi:hypothetical protein
MRGLLLTLLAVLAFAGCGEIKAEQEGSAACPNGIAKAEGKCKTKTEAERVAHSEQVEREGKEAEAVLRKRHAEELATQAEGR